MCKPGESTCRQERSQRGTQGPQCRQTCHGKQPAAWLCWKVAGLGTTQGAATSPPAHTLCPFPWVRITHRAKCRGPGARLVPGSQPQWAESRVRGADEKEEEGREGTRERNRRCPIPECIQNSRRANPKTMASFLNSLLCSGFFPPRSTYYFYKLQKQ